MKVGVLSDTHDRVPAARAGMEILRAAGAEFYIHCGDLCGESVLDVLAGEPSAIVFGNNDWERAELEAYCQAIGVRCLGDGGDLALGGKRVFVTHGHDGLTVRRVLSDQAHDYLLTGHTHVSQDTRVGRVRWVNPGALYRTPSKTVALIDTETDAVQMLQVRA